MKLRRSTLTLLPALALLLVLGAWFVQPYTVLAQQAAPADTTTTAAASNTGTSASSNTSTAAPAKSDEPDDGTCGWTHPFICLTDLVTFIPGIAMSYIIMPTMSLLVYLAGMILNWSVDYSVVNMASHLAAAQIDYVWSVIRDLSNMVFIFALLYTALQTMFGMGNYKETIKNIVLAAILINFSLFLTKAVIDAANVLALLFYHAIAPSADPNSALSVGIASGFMHVLNLQTVYGITKLSGTKIFIVGVMGTIIYLVAIFTFLAVAVMFMIRFVVLLFVIALSPIYFVGFIFPGTSIAGYKKQWQEALIGQAFFAPAYFALTWVALKVAQGLLTGYGTIDFAAALTGTTIPGTNDVKANPDAAGVFVIFAIIIALLLMALGIAKSLAAKAPGFVNKLTDQALGKVGGVTMGGAGWLGRQSVGRVGAAIGNNEGFKEAAAKGGFMDGNFRGGMARLSLAAGRKTSEKSFDARGAFGLGAALGAGKVSKDAQGGFKKTNEESAKKAAEKAKTYFADKDIVKADKDKRVEEKEAAEKRLEEARTAATAAAKTAHPDAAKSAGLIAAEKAEEEAGNALNTPLGIKDNPASKAALQKAYDEAKTKADEEREKHNEGQKQVEKDREEYVKTNTDEHERAVKEAKERADSDINKERAKAMEENEKKPGWRGKAAHVVIGGVTKRLPTVLPKSWSEKIDEVARKTVDIGRDTRAQKIRDLVKKKTKKEIAEEATLDYLKEQKEKEDTEKTASSGGEEKKDNEKGSEDKKSGEDKK